MGVWPHRPERNWNHAIPNLMISRLGFCRGLCRYVEEAYYRHVHGNHERKDI
jgi:hypothetical protein